MSICHGNGAEHCCYLEGQVCPFLEEYTIEGRRWACGLLRELGDWDAVHSDERYLTTVRPVWVEHGIDDCGDFAGARLEDGTIEPQCCYKEGANPPVVE